MKSNRVVTVGREFLWSIAIIVAQKYTLDHPPLVKDSCLVLGVDAGAYCLFEKEFLEMLEYDLVVSQEQFIDSRAKVKLVVDNLLHAQY